MDSKHRGTFEGMGQDVNERRDATAEPLGGQRPRRGSAGRNGDENGPASQPAPSAGRDPVGPRGGRARRRLLALAGAGAACAVLVTVGAGLVHAWSGPSAPFAGQAANYSEYTAKSGIEYRLVPLGAALGSPVRVEVRRLAPMDRRVIDARTGLSLVVDHRPIASARVTVNGVDADLAFDQGSGAWTGVVPPSRIHWLGANQWTLVAKAADGALLARFERKLEP
jgi:hypothetical protein